MTQLHTLDTSIVVEGTGLHTGAVTRVELHPAPAGSGRTFLCGDLRLPAHVEFVVDTRRCTTLGVANVTVRTVEHLLAALLLAGVDDVEMRVDGPELPALDGAALAWYTQVQAAGLRPQGGEAPVTRISAPAWVEDGESAFFLFPADELRAYAALDVPDTAVRRQCVGGAVDDPAVREQILRARTWGLEREVQALREAGLAQGGSLDNAVILTGDGYLNAQVWPQEPAWHKVLDLLGDLALLGTRLTGQILAVRGGHRSHVALAQRLREGAA